MLGKILAVATRSSKVFGKVRWEVERFPQGPSDSLKLFKIKDYDMRHTMKVSTIAVTLIAAGLPAQQAIQEDRPQVGASMQRPEDAQEVTRQYGFLVDHPAARVISPGTIEIEFETVEPTPPAMVYYGLNTLDEELNFPRFRSSLREKGSLDEWDTEHRVEIAFESLLDIIPNTPYESKISYRLAVWIPGKGERFYDSRVFFDSETLGDTTNILFGPVVDQVTGNSAVVSWETDRPSEGTVTVGKKSFKSSSDGLKHEVAVSGLNPGTTYDYFVDADETRTRDYSFRTQAGDEFSFIAMVDSREGVGGGERAFGGIQGLSVKQIISDAYYKDVDFILFPGDLVNGYVTGVDDFRLQLDSFRRMMEPVHARIPVYEGMGNHEALIDMWRDPSFGTLYLDKQGDESAEAIFAERFVNPLDGPEPEGPGAPPYAENVYTFDWGNARFIMLNNNYWWSSQPAEFGGNLEGYILPNQIQWLRQEVEKANANAEIDHLFVAAQEPPYPNGGHTADAMWYNGGDTNRDGVVDGSDIDIVENRNTMWDIISSSPKTVAFITGDEHAYSRVLISQQTDVGHRRKQNGEVAEFDYPVWQITSGGAGAPWYDKELDLPWSPELRKHSTQPHGAMIRVQDGNIVLEVYSQTGQQIDSAVLRRNGENVDMMPASLD